MATISTNRTSARTISLLSILLLLAALMWQRQAISDWIRLRSYEPPAAVVALADQTTMTDSARRLFYINHPVIQDRSSFHNSCSASNEHTIILGCYHSQDGGIYLFDVTDVRLNGVEQVTAAHEMLHVAYDRLSSAERRDLDRQLQNYYDHQVRDERLIKTLDAYRKSEPNDVVNEMHSIFATEISALPPSLESYYKRYFKDRSRVIAYVDAYRTEFTDREVRVKQYDAELATLKSQIDSNKSVLRSRQATINAERDKLNAYRSSGDIEAYNAGVGGYNAQVSAYNDLIEQTLAQIGRYNRLVAERNALAVEVQSLTKSLDSRLPGLAQ